MGVFVVEGMAAGKKKEVFHYFALTPELPVESGMSPLKGSNDDAFNADLGFGRAYSINTYTNDPSANTTAVRGFTQLTFDDTWPRLTPSDVLEPNG